MLNKQIPRFFGINKLRSINPPMRYILFLAVLFSQTGLFAQSGDKIISGTILLNTLQMPDAKALQQHLKTTWKIPADSMTVSDKTIIYNCGFATLIFAYLDYPMDPAEVGAAARLSWLWKTAAKDAGAHKAQLVVTVIGSDKQTTDLYKLFTKSTGAALEKTNASGVYMNSQYLLLEKGFYQAAAVNLRTNPKALPVYCWIYFGLLGEENNNGSFTFGLSEFGLPEMEISGSKHSVEEVHATLVEAVQYVIDYNLKLKDGQNLETSYGPLPVRFGKSVFTEGNAVSIKY
jgi:Domain of unknown function (DUF4261)